MKYFFLCLMLILLFGCESDAQSPRGFSLPEGNAESGQVVFEKYQCNDCHKIIGDTENESSQYLVVKPIPLGGSTGRVKTYAELVTSIINPSHKLTPRQPASFTSEDGVSLMRVVNDELTVSELIDLVAYLQPKYKVLPYRTSDYRLYQLRIPGETEESNN